MEIMETIPQMSSQFIALTRYLYVEISRFVSRKRVSYVAEHSLIFKCGDDGIDHYNHNLPIENDRQCTYQRNYFDSYLDSLNSIIRTRYLFQ